MTRMALRTALIWHDEVMEDLVLDKPRPITIGQSGRTTFVVPDIGLPPKFVIVRPGNRGYLLTLGERMRGTICIDGVKQDVAELVTRDSAGGFCATPIGGRDWGVIDLDPSGHYQLFFQFVPVDDPPQFFTRQVLIAGGVGYFVSSAALTLLWYLVKHLDLGEAVLRGAGIAALAMIGGAIGWSMIRQDGESQASLAFSVVFHAALLFMSYQLYDGENPFVWPGPRSLTGNYLVTRLDKEEPPEPKPAPTAGNTQQQEAPAAATKDPPKKTATRGEEGKAGGKGLTERARDPNAKELPPELSRLPQFQGREIVVGINSELANNLKKFAGLPGEKKTGDIGYGAGLGTGVGLGQGTGTRTGSKKGGPGGGGNAEGEFVTGPGRIDTGTERPGGNCKSAGCGTSPKAITVGFAEPAGDFGGLTSEEIDRVVKARAGVFRQCYQRELNHTPGIGGKLVIHFKIGGDGGVQSGNTATASGTTLHNDAVEQCVRRNVNLLKFPAKGGIANVNYPFVFTQGG